MTSLESIKELQKQKEKAQTLLTRYTTQLETLAEEKQKIVEAMKEEFGVSPESAEDELAKLEAKRDKLLEEAKRVLDKIE